jgi:hypothetical protein
MCHSNDFADRLAVRIAWDSEYIQVVSPRATLLRYAVPDCAIATAAAAITIAYLTTVKLKMAEHTTIALLPTRIRVADTCCAVEQPAKAAASSAVAIANATLVQHTCRRRWLR